MRQHHDDRTVKKKAKTVDNDNDDDSIDILCDGAGTVQHNGEKEDDGDNDGNCVDDNSDSSFKESHRAWVKELPRKHTPRAVVLVNDNNGCDDFWDSQDKD
jgi:hypothetical protein